MYLYAGTSLCRVRSLFRTRITLVKQQGKHKTQVHRLWTKVGMHVSFTVSCQFSRFDIADVRRNITISGRTAFNIT